MLESWQLPHQIRCTFCTWVVSIVRWVPESPRWLVQNGRIEHAESLLSKIAQFNKKSLPDFSKLDSCFQVTKLTISRAKSSAEKAVIEVIPNST